MACYSEEIPEASRYYFDECFQLPLAKEWGSNNSRAYEQMKRLKRNTRMSGYDLDMFNNKCSKRVGT